MAYQSLYRRYRPRRFSEVRGQEHLVSALRNAVIEDRVGHAYLFSGPRGTGKTSTARILAKVLNCENPVDGEPCCECVSCLAIEGGTSFDVHELDAASNNGVEAVRDLIAKASLGTPGRTKVYILDEVHMLSTAASNALLKTLEEPPDHVVFVLATTDPQKVLPTIRSRTQHFEVHLLPAADLEGLVDFVVADAGLELTPEGRTYVLRAGGGSARDTLSALDRVVAAGGAPDATDVVDELVEALCDHDTGRALVAVESAMSRGRNPRVLGESLIGRLRDVFLASVNADLSRLSDTDRERVTDQARRLTAPGATRALELLGEAFVGIQDALDPRIPLEVALVRLTRPDADTSVAALAERLARLERGAPAPAPSTTPAAAPAAPAPAATAPAAPSPAPTPPPSEPVAPAADTADVADDGDARDDGPPLPPGAGRADAARQALRERTGSSAAGGGPARPAATATTAKAPARPPSPPRPNRPGTPAAPSAPAADAPAGSAAPAAEAPLTAAEPVAPSPTPSPSPPAPEPEVAAPAAAEPAPAPAAPAASGGLPSRDQITLAWGDSLLSALPQKAKARFGGGHWVRVDDDAAVFGLPNRVHASRCEECRADVEAALAGHFGRPVPIRIVVDGDVPDPSSPPHLTVAPPPAADGGGSSAHDEGAGIDLDDLTDAPEAATSGLDRITAAFPGAEIVTDPTDA
jgi:DNA polymerase-3 subunit gamma/tau